MFISSSFFLFIVTLVLLSLLIKSNNDNVSMLEKLNLYERDNKESTIQIDKISSLLASERAGRIKGEKKLREIINESNKERFKPIGYMKSPFKARVGCPRQGGLVSARSEVVFDLTRVQPENSLQGITEYSHCWVIWEFHENTNIAGSVKAKVCPPRGNGIKCGLYATRTPHRHNNIGLSLAKIVGLSESGKSLILSGADLLDNTPILDIKPYIPSFESISTAIVPDWVGVVGREEMFEVDWSSSAIDSITSILSENKLKYYKNDDFDELKNTLGDIVRLQDIRNKFQKEKDTAEYSFKYDDLLVHINIDRAYNVDTSHDLNVVSSSSSNTTRSRVTRSMSRGRALVSNDLEMDSPIKSTPITEVVNSKSTNLGHVTIVDVEYKPVKLTK